MAFTGLRASEYAELLDAFSKACAKLRDEHTISGDARKRKPGAGRKPILAKEEDQLLFILFYLKTYPLQEVMSELFDMPTASVNEWIHRLLPIVHQALDDLGVLPERDAHKFAEQQTERPTGQDIVIDGTERRRQRPKNKDQ